MPMDTKNRSHPQLGELLLEEKAISDSQLRAALTMQHVLGGKLGEILLSHNCITKETLDDCLSRQDPRRDSGERGENGGTTSEATGQC
ncbi:MAG: hypothetical protein KBA61_17020 [Spirochaetes bacterium]|nr:hypothetical protein [Spirochaetota bacterium]